MSGSTRIDVPREERENFFDRPVLKRAIPPITVFSGFVIIGVMGFMYIGDVGPIEAVFWLIDLTSITVYGGGEFLKAYAIVTRVGIVISVFWIAETVFSAMFGGQITEEVRQMQREQQLQHVRNHVIVCGYGMFGRTVADGLHENGEDVVVIEMSENEHEDVLKDGYLGVFGDARREEVLEQAGVERAKAIVLAVDDSSVNIEISLIVRDLAPDIRLVVRVGDEMFTRLARRAGADDIVIPEVLSGRDIVDVL